MLIVLSFLNALKYVYHYRTEFAELIIMFLVVTVSILLSIICCLAALLYYVLLIIVIMQTFPYFFTSQWMVVH